MCANALSCTNVRKTCTLLNILNAAEQRITSVDAFIVTGNITISFYRFKKVLEEGMEKGWWDRISGGGSSGSIELLVDEFDPTDGECSSPKCIMICSSGAVLNGGATNIKIVRTQLHCNGAKLHNTHHADPAITTIYIHKTTSFPKAFSREKFNELFAFGRVDFQIT